MTVNYTTNLALGLPVTGTESGTWGDDVNNAITAYLDIAIAGGLSVAITTADITLSLTQGTSSATGIISTGATGSTAQYAILNISGAKTAARNLIVPSSSRYYIINNSAATGGYLLTVKGAATTGITLVDGEKAVVAWNGTDYVKIASSTISNLTGVLPVANGGTGLSSGTSGGVPYYSATGTIASSAALTLNAIVLGGGPSGAAPATTATGIGVVTAIGNAVNQTSGLVTQTATLTASALLIGGGVSTGIASTTTGTGVVTALGVNVGSAGAVVVNGGALGTPSSGALTNCTFPTLNQNTTGTAAGLSTTLAVASGGTGLTAGTSGGVLYYSAAGTLASSAALTLNAIVLGGGAGAAPVTTTTGTGVVAALSVNLGLPGAVVQNGSALGTPSSGTLTNCTFPTLNQNTTGTAAGLSTTLAVASGGTGITSAGTSGNALVSNGTAWASTTLPPDVASVNALVVSNNLSVALNAPWAGDFRSTTLSSGATTRVSISAGINLSVPSGATLGTVSGVAARIVLLAINNAGTVELAVVNIAGGNNLDETTLISTTAISTAADSDNVIYSTTARTSVAFRVVGYVDITEATAGTWATAPSTVQGAGGNAARSMSSLGYGQTWQNVTGSRALATTYYNTTGKPIFVSVASDCVGASTGQITINGLTITGSSYPSTTTNAVFASGIVPVGGSYKAENSGGTLTLRAWSELR